MDAEKCPKRSGVGTRAVLSTAVFQFWTRRRPQKPVRRAPIGVVEDTDIEPSHEHDPTKVQDEARRAHFGRRQRGDERGCPRCSESRHPQVLV